MEFTYYIQVDKIGRLILLPRPIINAGNPIWGLFYPFVFLKQSLLTFVYIPFMYWLFMKEINTNRKLVRFISGVYLLHTSR
jgi:hypothetical protein